MSIKPEIKKKYLDFPPVLVMEILSPPTALKDRDTKYDIYESQGIKYYLILEPNTEQIEVYELNKHTKRYEKNGYEHDFHYKFILDKSHTLIAPKEIW